MNIVLEKQGLCDPHAAFHTPSKDDVIFGWAIEHLVNILRSESKSRNSSTNSPGRNKTNYNMLKEEKN